MKPPAGIVVPTGMTYPALLLSWTMYPEMSAVVLPVLYKSTQSPGVPPLDSTSLILTASASAPQSFSAPLVGAPVVAKGPVAFGQRP
jgi:hypothetical protein